MGYRSTVAMIGGVVGFLKIASDEDALVDAPAII